MDPTYNLNGGFCKFRALGTRASRRWLQDAAHELGATPRTLQRRTGAILGKTPIVLIQDIRVERAQHLLSIGRRMEQVASEVGYADTATLRALMRRRLGRGLHNLQSKGCVKV